MLPQRSMNRNMALAVASEDRFRASCNDSRSYPCNLVETPHPTYALQAWHGMLKAESEQIFDGHEASLDVLEVSDETGGGCPYLREHKDVANEFSSSYYYQ